MQEYIPLIRGGREIKKEERKKIIMSLNEI
jgi:hypothetical protein